MVIMVLYISIGICRLLIVITNFHCYVIGDKISIHCKTGSIYNS